MNETTARRDNAFRRIIGAAIASVVVGGLIVVIGIGLDWGGFGGGLALGAGVGLVLVGAYFGGFAHGLRQAMTRVSAAPGTWLPSRDGRG